MQSLADDIETFTTSARVPDELSRLGDDVVLYSIGLPPVVRDYGNFALRVGDAVAVPVEVQAQKDRFLLSLVGYAMAKTGQPHFRDIADLISGWRARFPAVSGVYAEKLRKQFERALSRPHLEPLWPEIEAGAS